MAPAMPSGDIDMMTLPRMQRAANLPGDYLDAEDDLELTPQQVDSFKTLESTLKKETITKGAAVKVKEIELSDIVREPDFDLSAAVAKLKEVEAARTELRASVLKIAAQARDLLTKEQLKDFKDSEHSDNKAMVPGGIGQPSEEMRQMMMEKMMKKQ
jgi:Spy/CpxP family protein refolding chaperone